MSRDPAIFDSSRLEDGPNRTSSDQVVFVDRNKPQFLSSGHLPPGFHDATLKGLASLVCFNNHRSEMWRRLCTFLLWPAQSNDFTWAYLGGGFLSSRPDPDDIDLVLQTKHSYGAGAFKAIEPFFSNGLNQIQDVYGVHLHFWIEEAPKAICDFRIFLQYTRPKNAVMVIERAHGVIKIDLRASENLLGLQRFANDPQNRND